VQRPSGLIKMDGSASGFEVESVPWKIISIINPNHYWILLRNVFFNFL
jgi:hypothetical protein